VNPLIKWIGRPEGEAATRRVGWSVLGGHEASCSGTWLKTSAELETEAEAEAEAEAARA